MKYKYILSAFAAMLMFPATGNAQLQFDSNENRTAYILPASDTIDIDYGKDAVSVPVMSTGNYTVKNENAWLKCVKEQNGNLTLFSSDNYDALQSRFGTIELSTEDGKFTRNLVIRQSANTSASHLKGDTRLTISSAKASSSQSGEGIERTYDNNYSTLWHSSYSGGGFPITLTYTLKNDPHVDYMLYTPRCDGQNNGNFGNIKVEYTLATAPNTWVEVIEKDLGGSGSAARIDFGENGVDQVRKVRITVKSGQNNFASCSEMGFYENDNETADLFSRYFKDNLCSQLKDGITEADENTISNDYVRQLVHNIRTTDYSTKYRVGTFEPYRSLSDLQNELKTSSQYCAYENPTGIYFKKGESIVLFVEGIQDDGVSLIIKSFGPETYTGEGQPQSSYPLHNGVNLINTANRGNGYISYYTTNYKNAPNVKIHFAMATENGYFDLERGDTNEDWINLLANATSDVIDVRSKCLQFAGLLSVFREVCPRKGVELATAYNNTVYREREIMGFYKYNHETKNRQFARGVANGFMFADGTGAAIQYGSLSGVCNPDNFGYWGLGHELGHNNQIWPGLKWSGCGETTNNIYAAWVEHKEGNGYHRLEDEVSGIDDYRSMRGGRFNTYLEEGVRKGISWQLQDGPDYHGTTPASKTVMDEDYEGNKTKTITTTSRNYDHFVKLVPFFQLELFMIEAGKAPDTFADVFESIRLENDADKKLSNGQLEVKCMKRFCDASKMNLLPFFEKAGLFRPINAYIEDYSAGWIKINQEMLDELAAYVKAQGYTEAPAGLNFINAYNWKVFRDNAPLINASLGAGCASYGTKVRIDNNVWKNAVAYKTYDADGNLIRISMFGLGDAQQSSRYTHVLFPAEASYINAVGYDGTEIKCYQR